jgi:hypothetical protein
MPQYSASWRWANFILTPDRLIPCCATGSSSTRAWCRMLLQCGASCHWVKMETDPTDSDTSFQTCLAGSGSMQAW